MTELMMATTVGVELEYVGETQVLADALAEGGWCNRIQHGYHCDCQECAYAHGLLWRYQRDSTVSGEFITRIIGDWATARQAFGLMGDAIERVNKPPKPPDRYWAPPIQTSMATGLHVHVFQDVVNFDMLVGSYLQAERWMQRIGSGPYADKREGMNITFLGALRERGYRPGQIVTTTDAIYAVRGQIDSDRHIDLNHSRNHGTYEFRVYNSTTEAWQMELAVRLTLAFCLFARNQYYVSGENIRIPALPIQTLQPPWMLRDFIDQLCQWDEDLRPLIDRQLATFPERGDEDTVPAAVTEPPTQPEPQVQQPIDHSMIVEPSGALMSCYCDVCQDARQREPLVLRRASADTGFEALLAEEERIQSTTQRNTLWHATTPWLVDPDPNVDAYHYELEIVDNGTLVRRVRS